MTDGLCERIERALAAADRPLTVQEVAAEVGCDRAAAEQIVWGSPDRFTWQPKGRWTLSDSKRSPAPPASEAEHDDARDALLAPPGAVELRAILLDNGSVLRVVRRPLDSPALFTVSQAGSDLQLVLNSSHELFAELPMPFDDEQPGGDYKRFAELLLAAWAVNEGNAPAGPSKRALEDARLMWGRALIKSFLSSP